MTTQQAQTLTMERTFSAPRDRVYRAFTDPAWFARWWGPPGTQNSDVAMDVRVGGAYVAHMKTPEYDMILEGHYTRVEPHRLLAYTFQWRGQPIETAVTIELEDAPGGGTLVKFRQEGFGDAQGVEQHRDGRSKSFDRLAEVVAAG